MKRFFTILAALAAASAFAQGFKLPATAPRFTNLLSPKVQTELAIDARQKKRLEAVFKKVAASGGKGIMITPATDLKALEREATEILKPEQKTRLEQIWLQREGGMALTDPETARKLALTEDQQKRIVSLFDDMEASGRTGVTAADQNGKAQIDARACRKETGTKMLALLTNEQREKFETMKGARFDFEVKRVQARRDGG